MSERNDSLQKIQIAVATISVGCALLHAFYPDRIDEKTAMFLTLAMVALVIQQVTKFKGFGIEFEQKVEHLQAGLESLEKTVGPGSKSATAPEAAELQIVANNGPIDTEDPNKNQFGGQAESNGRKITATIKPLGGERSARCLVTIRVVSTEPTKPLTGKVKLHLHPTFGRWSKYSIDALGGVAEDEVESYGAFTIGAQSDGGQTKLELDLMNVPGGTKRFYES